MLSGKTKNYSSAHLLHFDLRQNCSVWTCFILKRLQETISSSPTDVFYEILFYLYCGIFLGNFLNVFSTPLKLLLKNNCSLIILTQKTIKYSSLRLLKSIWSTLFNVLQLSEIYLTWAISILARCWNTEINGSRNWWD